MKRQMHYHLPRTGKTLCGQQTGRVDSVNGSANVSQVTCQRCKIVLLDNAPGTIQETGGVLSLVQDAK